MSLIASPAEVADAPCCGCLAPVTRRTKVPADGRVLQVRARRGWLDELRGRFAPGLAGPVHPANKDCHRLARTTSSARLPCRPNGRRLWPATRRPESGTRTSRLRPARRSGRSLTPGCAKGCTWRARAYGSGCPASEAKPRARAAGPCSRPGPGARPPERGRADPPHASGGPGGACRQPGRPGRPAPVPPPGGAVRRPAPVTQGGAA